MKARGEHRESSAASDSRAGEQRRAARVTCRLVADIQLPSGIVRAPLMNISERGTFVRLSRLEERPRLRLVTRMTRDVRIHLGFAIAGDSRPHEAEALVAWQSDLGAGLEFTSLTPLLRRFIREAVDGRAAELLARVQSVSVRFAS